MATVSLTNYASQVAEIERQKKLAELLQQQAQQPIEIQSYKGIQAPIPWSAVLAKVLGQVGGQIKEARAIKKAGELADLDRKTAAGLPEQMQHTVTMDNVRSLAGPQMQPTGMGGQAAPTAAPATAPPQAPIMQPTGMGGKLASLLSQGGQAAPVNPTAAFAMAPPAPVMPPPQAPITQSNLPPVAPGSSQANLARALGGETIAPPPQIQSASEIAAQMAKGFVPAQRDVTLDRALSPAEQQQMALKAMYSGGPATESMGKLLYSSATERQTKAEDRAYDKEVLGENRAYDVGRTEEARNFGEAQRLKLIDEKKAETQAFIDSYSQYAPKDASGKPLVDPMQFAALATAGDLAGAAKLYANAGIDYQKAQADLSRFNQEMALKRQELNQRREIASQDRAAQLQISGRATDRQIQTAGTGLRKEFNLLPEVKNYRVVNQEFKNIQSAGAKATPAGDTVMVFKFMKILDPTSVVRESEQATARNANAIPDRIRNLYNRALKGTPLTPEQRLDFIEQTRKINSNSEMRFNEIANQYSSYAADYGISPQTVIGLGSSAGGLGPRSNW